jgi:hypothetical protein
LTKCLDILRSSSMTSSGVVGFGEWRFDRSLPGIVWSLECRFVADKLRASGRQRPAGRTGFGAPCIARLYPRAPAFIEPDNPCVLVVSVAISPRVFARWLTELRFVITERPAWFERFLTTVADICGKSGRPGLTVDTATDGRVTTYRRGFVVDLLPMQQRAFSELNLSLQTWGGRRRRRGACRPGGLRATLRRLLGSSYNTAAGAVFREKGQCLADPKTICQIHILIMWMLIDRQIVLDGAEHSPPLTAHGRDCQPLPRGVSAPQKPLSLVGSVPSLDQPLLPMQPAFVQMAKP